MSNRYNDSHPGFPQAAHVDYLIGQYAEWSSGVYPTGLGSIPILGPEWPRTLVAAQNVVNFGLESRGYYYKALMSLEGLVRPVAYSPHAHFPCVSTDYETGVDVLGYNPTKHTLAPIPPFGTVMGTGTGGNPELKPNQPFPYYNNSMLNRYLNPFAPTNDVWMSGKNELNGLFLGHDIDLIARGTGISGSLSTYIAGDDGSISGYLLRDYDEDIAPQRFLALRGPIMLTSWGYDTDGKPIPNAVDDEVLANNGEFYSSPHDTFLDSWLRKPHTWPVGPIDLRWDRNRCVWTCPPSYEPVLVTLKAGIGPGTTGYATINNIGFSNLRDSSGVSISLTNSGSYTIVNSYGTNSYSASEVVPAWFSTRDQKWYLFPKGGAGGGGCSGVSEGIPVVTDVKCNGGFMTISRAVLVFSSGTYLGHTC